MSIGKPASFLSHSHLRIALISAPCRNVLPPHCPCRCRGRYDSLCLPYRQAGVRLSSQLCQLRRPHLQPQRHQHGNQHGRQVSFPALVLLDDLSCLPPFDPPSPHKHSDNNSGSSPSGYPHAYYQYADEHITLSCNDASDYLEFPLENNRAFTGGSPGAYRAIFTEDGEFCAVVYHASTSDNSFAQCRY